MQHSHRHPLLAQECVTLDLLLARPKGIKKMWERNYEISPVPLSLSPGVPAYCIDFIKGDGTITPLEVGVDESEARVLGDAWVAGHDVVRQIMDGVPIKTILTSLGSSGVPE